MGNCCRQGGKKIEPHCVPHHAVLIAPVKRRQTSHRVGVRDYALPLRLTGNLPLTIGLMAPSAKCFLSKMPESARSALLKAAGY
jgi:hypothetical protein